MSKLEGQSLLVVAPDAGTGSAEAMGLGDVVRILQVLCTLNAKQIIWASDSGLYALVHLFENVDRTIEISAASDAADQVDCVLNIDMAPLRWDHPNVVEVSALLAGGGSIKERTFDLPQVLGRHFDIDVERLPIIATTEPTFDVGFNLRVPENWQIKAMPDALWAAVEKSMPAHVSVTWQPEQKQNLAQYIDWVSSVRVLVSVVGFGCHLAMLFGRPLVVLSGPTDFMEAHTYNSGAVLRPGSPCTHRPCYNPEGVDCNGCIQDMDTDTISKTVLAFLEGKVIHT